MIYTKTQAVAILTKRLSRLLAQANLVGDTFDEELAVAIAMLGGTVSNPLAVVDADLATVPTDRGELMLDMAELSMWDVAGYAWLEGSGNENRVNYLRQRVDAGLLVVAGQDTIHTGVIDLHMAQDGENDTLLTEYSWAI